MREYIVKDDGTGFVEQVGELIRCKGCKHYTGYECQRVKISNVRVITKNIDYCSYAERKKG